MLDFSSFLLLGNVSVLAIFVCFTINKHPLNTAIWVMCWTWFSYTIIEWFVFSNLIRKSILYTDEFFIIILFVFVFLSKLLNKTIRLNRSDILFGGFVFSGLISAYLNKVPIFIALSGMLLLSKGYMLFWSISNLNVKFEKKIIFNPLIMVGLLVAAIAILEIIFPFFINNLVHKKQIVSYRLGIPEIKSIFTTSSAYGWFASIVSFIFFLEYMNKHKVKYLMLCLLFIVLTIFSMRSKAIVALFLTICGTFIFLFQIKKNRAQNYLIGFSFILCISVVVFQSPVVPLISQQANKYIFGVKTIDTARNVLARTSIYIAQDNFPFGVGFGRYGGHIARLHYSPVYYEYGLYKIYGLAEGKGGMFLTDTFWPSILGETGVIGTVFYLLTLGDLFLFIFRRIRNNKSIDSGENFFIVWVGMVFFAAIVDSIAQPVFTRSPQYFLIFFVIGCSKLLIDRDILLENNSYKVKILSKENLI